MGRSGGRASETLACLQDVPTAGRRAGWVEGVAREQPWVEAVQQCGSQSQTDGVHS